MKRINPCEQRVTGADKFMTEYELYHNMYDKK